MFSEACQGPEKLMAWYVLIRPCLYKYVILDFSDMTFESQIVHYACLTCMIFVSTSSAAACMSTNAAKL
jgi:hypothetical protein